MMSRWKVLCVNPNPCCARPHSQQFLYDPDDIIDSLQSSVNNEGFNHREEHEELFPSLCPLEYAAHVLIAELQDVCCKEK